MEGWKGGTEGERRDNFVLFSCPLPVHGRTSNGMSERRLSRHEVPFRTYSTGVRREEKCPVS